MKNALLLFCFFFLEKQLPAQNSADQTWVIISYIKESAKTDYEKWMTDIFFASMQSSQDPVLKQQYSTARWQKPVRQNADKTWTYGILLDPAIPNADYGIESFLVKTYGEAKGKNYAKQYEGFMASSGQIHFFETSKGLMTPSVNSDEEAIKKVISDEGIAFNQGNIDAFMNTQVDAPYLLWTVTNGGEPGDVLTYRGYKALKEFAMNLPWFKNFKPESDQTAKVPTNTAMRDNWNFQFRGNVAIVNFDEHWDTEKQKVNVTVIKVLEKINGNWKITNTSALADFKDATPPIRTKY
jgi:hypothetical protein